MQFNYSAYSNNTSASWDPVVTTIRLEILFHISRTLESDGQSIYRLRLKRATLFAPPSLQTKQMNTYPLMLVKSSIFNYGDQQH